MMPQNLWWDQAIWPARPSYNEMQTYRAPYNSNVSPYYNSVNTQLQHPWMLPPYVAYQHVSPVDTTPLKLASAQHQQQNWHYRQRKLQDVSNTERWIEQPNYHHRVNPYPARSASSYDHLVGLEAARSHTSTRSRLYPDNFNDTQKENVCTKTLEKFRSVVPQSQSWDCSPASTLLNRKDGASSFEMLQRCFGAESIQHQQNSAREGPRQSGKCKFYFTYNFTCKGIVLSFEVCVILTS